jgi:hypothetical protein
MQRGPIEMKDRARLVEAAGLLTPEMTAYEVFCISCALHGDTVLEARALALGFECDEKTGEPTCVMAADHEDYINLVNDMTPSEREELRGRMSPAVARQRI